jgi:hypothetical protein
MRRTRNQIVANEFDCDLYRLLGRADAYAAEGGLASRKWRDAYNALSQARPIIRGMMSIEDREKTS